MTGLLAAAESTLLAEEHVFDLGVIREAVTRECCLQVDEAPLADNAAVII